MYDIGMMSVRQYILDTLDQKGVWRTIRGQKVFIREGESPKDALMRKIGAMKKGGWNESWNKVAKQNDEQREKRKEAQESAEIASMKARGSPKKALLEKIETMPKKTHQVKKPKTLEEWKERARALKQALEHCRATGGDMIIDDSFQDLVNWVLNRGLTNDEDEAIVIAWKIINSRRRKAHLQRQQELAEKHRETMAGIRARNEVRRLEREQERAKKGFKILEKEAQNIVHLADIARERRSWDSFKLNIEKLNDVLRRMAETDLSGDTLEQYKMYREIRNRFNQMLLLKDTSPQTIINKIRNRIGRKKIQEAKELLSNLGDLLNSSVFNISYEERDNLLEIFRDLEEKIRLKEESIIEGMRIEEVERRREEARAELGIGTNERIPWEISNEVSSGWNNKTTKELIGEQFGEMGIGEDWTFRIEHPTRLIDVCTAHFVKEKWLNPVTEKYEEVAYLASLWTDPRFDSMGAGTTMGVNIIKWADEHNITIVGHASPFERDESISEGGRRPDQVVDDAEIEAYGRNNFRKLVKFYRSFGGVPFSHGGTSVSLVRFPKKKRRARAELRQWVRQAGYNVVAVDAEKPKVLEFDPRWLMEYANKTFYYGGDGMIYLFNTAKGDVR